MQEKQITPEFLQALGQTLIDFGFMESIIRAVMYIVDRDLQLARPQVFRTNTVSENLNLLKDKCQQRMTPEVYAHWLEAIEDLRMLFHKRNDIFHGMFYEVAGELFIGKLKRDAQGKAIEREHVTFDPDSVNDLINRLTNRRRQLMDFVDDFMTSDGGNVRPASQYVHPVLSL